MPADDFASLRVPEDDDSFAVGGQQSRAVGRHDNRRDAKTMLTVEDQIRLRPATAECSLKVPKLRRVLAASGQNPFAILRDFDDAIHSRFGKRRQLAAERVVFVDLRVPDSHRSVETARQQPLSIRKETHREQIVFMSFREDVVVEDRRFLGQRFDSKAGLTVPHASRLIA